MPSEFGSQGSGELLPESGSILSPAVNHGSESILTPPQPAWSVETDTRDMGDTARMRDNIYRQVLEAAQQIQPVSNARHTLRVTDVRYQDPERFSKRDQKAAILQGISQGRRLQGTWELVDNETDSVIDRKRSVLMTVPHATERGTFINRGTEYTLKNQQRLLPGVFTRVKDNGEVESHVNVMPGKGQSHRYFLDPARGVFKVQVGQGTVSMMPLLKAMGATGQQIKEAWGNELYQANFNSDNAREAAKLRQKFLTAKELEGDENEQRESLRQKFENMELDPEVTQETLGAPYTGLSLDALLAISKRLIAVSKHEQDPDDRDAMPYQRFYGPEDLMSERILRDKGNTRRQLLWKASARGNLRAMPSSALSKQLNAALMTSGLGNALEEINPAELFDKLTIVSRLGEGGIKSTDSIPKESRSVQPSMFGYIDPLRTPESSKVGVDTYFASGAKKGKDGKLYARFHDVRTGESVYKTPQESNKLTIGFPASLTRPTKYVPAMRGGRTVYVTKDKIDLVLPHMEDALNPLSNMIPMKSQVKGQRLVMATRMTTQALPIVGGEAPLVQSAVPGSNGSKSYESLYASNMGVLRTKKPGVVVSTDNDEIVVRHDDGTTETHELYNNFPFNRKSQITQTAVVQPGQRVDSDGLLAKSNFSDDRGDTALGRNARTAYIAWQGKNFEDAVVISESFARKMASEHMYQHSLDTSLGVKTGKKPYVSVFAGKFDKKTLAKLGNDGVIREGEKVEYGDPLILGVSERETSHNRVHKKGQAGFNDASVLWEHHDPGVVTDVVHGKNGPAVVVKAQSVCNVGDKLCYDPETYFRVRHGWKLVADITKDDEIATLNPDTDCLEWHRPTALHKFQHNGEMYFLNNKHVNMLVTPNHNLWVAHENTKQLEFQAVPASEFYTKKGVWRFKKDCKWVGREIPVKTLESRESKHPACQPLADVPMDLWLEFLGYYLAEGDISQGQYVRISQFRSSPHWSKIDKVLQDMGLRYSYLEKENRFVIGSVRLSEVLEPLGNSYTKRIPDDVQECCPRQLKIFLDAYLDGDGHRGNCTEYGSSSQRLAEDIQLVCMKLGWAVSLRPVERKDNWQKTTHWRGRINTKHLQPIWNRSKKRLYPNRVEEFRPYSGMVYCVTVPNHIIYVKREEKTYWSLNSGRYG